MSGYVRTKLFILLLALLAVMLGYNYFVQPFAHLNQPIALPPETNSAPTPTPAPTVATASAGYDARAALLSLTPRQRAALLLAAPLHVTPLDMEMGAFIRINQPGLVTLFGTEISSQSARLAVGMAEQQASGSASARKPLIAVDHEGGVVARLSGEGFLRLPSWQQLCAMNEPSRQAAMQQTANELRANGVDVVLGPVIDVGTGESALGDRLCSSEATVVSAMAQSFIAAYLRAGIVPVVKHFPGIGALTKDLHDVFASHEATPAEQYTFKSVLDRYPTIGVMVSPMGVTNQFAQLPCLVSRDCVGQLTAVYPLALIVSDGIEMKAARYNAANPAQPKSLAQTALEAVLAGNDVVLFGDGVKSVDLDAVLTALTVEYGRSASVSARIDQSAQKVLQLMQQANPDTIKSDL